MAAFSSVIEVLCEGEEILTFPSVPTFEEMCVQLEEHLGATRDAFVLYYTDTEGEAHQLSSSGEFQDAFAATGLPFKIHLDWLEGSLICPYCDNLLQKNESQCQNCKTVNWDAWIVDKYGDEIYRTLMETKGREAKGFSFGPVDMKRPLEQIFEEDKKAKGGASKPGFVDEDEDLNQRGSLGEFQRGSFGEVTETGKFETPPRKPSPIAEIVSNPRYRMSEDLIDLQTPPARSSEPRSDGKPLMETPPAKVPGAIPSESPSIERKAPGPLLSRPYRSGLQPSPYLSPEKSGVHDRTTCEICQRSKRSDQSYAWSSGHDRATCELCQRSIRDSSILTGHSNYKNSLFRHSRVTGDSSTLTRDSYGARKSSPLRNSSFMSDNLQFASHYSCDRTCDSPSQFRTSFTQPLRESSPTRCRKGSPVRTSPTVWLCRNCPSRSPWYFTHCQKCELTQSLEQQPLDSYKRRVELMCRR